MGNYWCIQHVDVVLTRSFDSRWWIHGSRLFHWFDSVLQDAFCRASGRWATGWFDDQVPRWMSPRRRRRLFTSAALASRNGWMNANARQCQHGARRANNNIYGMLRVMAKAKFHQHRKWQKWKGCPWKTNLPCWIQSSIPQTDERASFQNSSQIQQALPSLKRNLSIFFLLLLFPIRYQP